MSAKEKNAFGSVFFVYRALIYFNVLYNALIYLNVL